MGATDEALMARVAEGDAVAFELLLGRYEHRLYNYILRLLGDAEESRDVFQEAFLKVYQNAQRFDPQRRFSTWVYTIAGNACRDRLRRRRPAASLDDPLPGGDDESRTLREAVPAAGASPAETAAEWELEDRVRAAIERLPEAQREVVVLREYEHRSCEEIAEIVGCKVGTVKSRMFYAMAALRRMLAPLADEGVGR